MRDRLQADLRLGQLLELPFRPLHVFVEAPAHFPVLAERGKRLRGDRVDRVRADELLDVVRIRITRVFGRRARPQAALRERAGLLQLLPAGPIEELFESLIRQLRVGDRGLAVQALERLLLPGIGGGVDLFRQLLVDLGVDAADEEARDAGNLCEVPSVAVQLLQAR